MEIQIISLESIEPGKGFNSSVGSIKRNTLGLKLQRKYSYFESDKKLANELDETFAHIQDSA